MYIYVLKVDLFMGNIIFFWKFLLKKIEDLE